MESRFATSTPPDRPEFAILIDGTELEAEVSGTIEILIAEGEEVGIGTVVAKITEAQGTQHLKHLLLRLNQLQLPQLQLSLLLQPSLHR
mgnify:CR=1 FL=1